MYDIVITNSQTCVDINEERLHQSAEHLLREEQIREAEISIVLLDNAEIHELNRQYLQHDYPTDVLSFLLESEELPADESSEAGTRIEGEVIISTEMAREMAEDFEWSAEDETLLYLIHGLLHMTGYDDLTPEDQQIMRQREREILQHWQLVPRYADGEPPPDLQPGTSPLSNRQGAET